MATKLFLRNTTNNGITDTGDGILYDLSTVAGSSVDTAVTNTTAGGTEIQATKTAGGSTIAWISGRAPAGGFTLTNADISLWQVESNMNANIGGRFRVFKRTAAGVVTEIAGGPYNDGAEMNTSDREDLWDTITAGLTDTAFAEDDRILLRYYVTNAGTMAAGHTGTLKFNAANAATGDSFFNIAETVTFKPDAQTISGVGNIASAETFGTAKLNRNLLPPSIASAEAIGTHSVGGELSLGDGLISFWTLGENTGTTRLDSVGGNNLTEQGGTVAKVSPGKVGDAATFNQTNYLRIADNAPLSVTGSFSIWAWVRMSSSLTSANPGIMGKWAHTDQRSYAFRYDGSKFNFSVSADGTGATGGNVQHSLTPSAATWYFLQGYVDLVGDVMGFRIGTVSSIGSWETASYTASGVFNGTADFEIGRLGTSGDVWYGDIDAAGISGRRISEANWGSLWNNGNGIELVTPAANAGYDQTRMELETVYLDGTQSLGDGLTYSWAQLSGTSVTLNNPTTPTPNFTAPDVSTPETLVFELTVTETDLDTAADQVSIRIVPTGSTEWLWYTPLEIEMNADLFYPAFDSLPTPSLVARSGRLIAAKGDITLEGYTWSASKMLTALIFARQRLLGNVDYTNTVPGSDNPSSPLATYLQFLTMTSDFGLSPHSPGNNAAYNNGAVHHYGTHLKTTFYSGLDHVQTLQSAYVTALGFEDSLIYETTTWAGDNKMSGWNGGWKMSTRDLARITQLVLQRGMWNGTQILDPDFCARMWALSIPGVTPSTDEDDEFYNDVGASAVLDEQWGLGFWYLPAAGFGTESAVMFGKYGTSAYACRRKNLIAVACNVGGETDDSTQTKILSSQFAALANSITDADSQFLWSDGTGIASAQAFGTTSASASISAAGIASNEAIGSTTLSQGSSNVAPTAIDSAEVVEDPVLNMTVTPSGIVSTEAIGSPAFSLTISSSAIATNEALGTASLSRTVTTSGIASTESFGLTTVSSGAITISVSAIGSAEAFGSHTVQPGSVTLAPPSITTSEAFGSAVVSSGALFVAPSAITSGEAIGTASLARAVSVSGITSAEAFGATNLARTVSTTAIVTAEALGTAFLSRTISLSGITSAELFGDPVVSTGASFVVPVSINSVESFGPAVVSTGSVTVSPSAVTSSEAFGLTALAQSVHISSVASQEAFGTGSLHRSLTAISVASGESIGALVINSGGVILSPSAISSFEAFGPAALSSGSVTITPTSIEPLEAFGSAAVTSGVTVLPGGIVSAEGFGVAFLSRSLHVPGVASVESFGSAQLSITISAPSIGPQEAFGQPGLGLGVSPTEIVSSEEFGVTTVNRGSVLITLTGIPSTEAFGAVSVGVNLSPQPTAIITVMTKPIATLSVQSKPSATITKWPS